MVCAARTATDVGWRASSSAGSAVVALHHAQSSNIDACPSPSKLVAETGALGAVPAAMPKPSLLAILIAVPLSACSSTPNDVEVTLAPEVISSLDGTATVQVTLFHDTSATDGKPVDLTIAYTDRNGTAHAITAASGSTDKRGVYETTLTGLMWDGTGTVTATAGAVTGEATFAVLDRTPPVVTIAPATLMQNNDTTVMVHVTDEIGISQVSFETTGDTGGGGGGGGGGRQGTTIAIAGETDAMVPFDVGIGTQVPVGTVITMYAVASDLSGNEGVATPITATVN